ncbi:MAG: TonB-dependent receptor plug domain-containing protein, partial [Sphingomonadales bacterium]
MNFKWRLVFVSLLFFQTIYGQQNVPGIYGWIEDKETGERIENALVIDSSDLQYTYSNRDGYYNMGIGSGRHVLLFAAAGYYAVRMVEDVYSSTPFNIQLKPLEENKDDTTWNKYHAIFDLRSGHVSPTRKQTLQMNSLLSIPDPVKLLQFLPGVSGGIEGLSGMYVRGGNSDQNLMMMDGLPIYGNGHIFGFLSSYNPELLGSTEFYRGVAPARYGGRAGAILDVGIREGNTKTWTGSYSQDLLLFNATANGPLNKTGTVTGSFGLRRTWLDMLLPKDGDVYAYYGLYDLNGKVTWKVDERNKLSFFAYSGRDKFVAGRSIENVDSLNRVVKFNSNLLFNWKNNLYGVNWARKINNRHYGNFMLGMTKAYGGAPFEIGGSIKSDTSFSSFQIKSENSSSIFNIIGKANLEYRLKSNTNLRYGGEWILHSFSPTTVYVSLSSNGKTGLDTTFGLKNKSLSPEVSIYGEYEKNLGAGLKVNIGGRIWSFMGNGKTWIRPEPRILISQILQDQKALKLGFSVANQGVHRLGSVNANLPGDIWFPTGGNIRPQQTLQITGGFYQPWKKGLEFSMELYLKSFDGITDLTGRDENDYEPRYWERMLAQGTGRAYGIEFLLMKKIGRLNGSAGYTLSRSDRNIPDINFGESYPFRWDRRHKISFQGVYALQKNWTIQFSGVWMTGNAVTVPTGQYLSADGILVLDYTAKNNYRMPFYSRFDFGFTKKLKPYLRRSYN